MRLRIICFFVCETYLSACSAVLTDEYTVGGAKRQALLNPDDDLVDLPRSMDRDYADFWRVEGCPTLSEQDEQGECCTTEGAREDLCRPVSEGSDWTSNCRRAQPCGPTQTTTPVTALRQHRPSIPTNAPLYDLVIYPTAPSAID